MLTHFEPLEADLARFYQVDLPVALWGPEPISVRRLEVLVAGLPKEAMVVRKVAPESQWGNVEELLAVLVEVVDAGNRAFVSAHSPRGTQLPKPVEIIRPWTKKVAAATGAELARWLSKAGGVIRYHPKGG